MRFWQNIARGESDIANANDIFCKIKIATLQQIYCAIVNQAAILALARCLLNGARRCDGRGARKER